MSVTQKAQSYLDFLFCFLIQIFYGGGKHQFDSVQLVDLAGTRIVIDGHDIGTRIAVTQFLDDTLAVHMVRQAGERLRADDVRCSGVDQL